VSQAAREALTDLERFIPQPEAGLILIDGHGGIGAAHTTAAMPIAWVDGDGTVQATMRGGL
jgi:isoaspartyl peptidase/L-asparaginase-like protein (Ntn-hydrolase superfamily)